VAYFLPAGARDNRESVPHPKSAQGTRPRSVAIRSVLGSVGAYRFYWRLLGLPYLAGSVRAVVRGGETVVDRGVRRKFRDGDPEAVRIVYRSYGRLVYAVAYRVLGDGELAEDATQQTFLKAWRAAGSLDEDREMGPWLATIARRAAIDVHRGEARRADSIESVAPADPALTSQPESAEALYSVWEVRRAVTELPPDEQEVVRLQHFEGLTHAEIAQRLELPAGTVKSRSFRAHKRLAARLEHVRDEPDDIGLP
jgi:RNA polymerase sigma factor (sigma-70 family)